MLKIDKDLKDYIRISLLADLLETKDLDNTQAIADEIIKGLEAHNAIGHESAEDLKRIEYQSNDSGDKLAA